MKAQRFKVDLRKYGPGICVGVEKLIVACPVCGEGSYREGYSGGTRYVHSGMLSNGPEGLEWKRELVCRVKWPRAQISDHEEAEHD
jgi:hypothetical protein